jgi:hypothetical protein
LRILTVPFERVFEIPPSPCAEKAFPICHDDLQTRAPHHADEFILELLDRNDWRQAVALPAGAAR